MSVRDDLRIDKFNLDLEWLEHPLKVEKYHSILADVTYKRDILKIKLDKKSGEIANDIRMYPSEYEIDGSVTDAKVKELIAAHPDVLNLKYELADAEAEVIAANGIRKALADRKDALQDMVKLFLSGYWAKPYIKQEDKEHYLETDTTNKDALNANERMTARKTKKD